MTMTLTALLMERHKLKQMIARREAIIERRKREMAAFDHRLFDVERLIRIEKELAQ